MVKSWPQAPALHCTFTPLLLFSRKQGEFPGEKGIRAFLCLSLVNLGLKERGEEGRGNVPRCRGTFPWLLK